jgi:Ice-binding-like
MLSWRSWSGNTAQGGDVFNRLRAVPLSLVATAVVAAAWPASAFAATTPRLGTALNFAVLAGSTITNTGATVISGELGLRPGSSVTGFPPGSTTGTKHIADGVALQAKNDLVTAYTDAANSPTTADLTGTNLGGLELNPGVYSFSSSAQLTGSLTLSLHLQDREHADHREQLGGSAR